MWSDCIERLDAKTKKHPDKNKPGFDWVADPSVKDGGYYRKAKSSAGSTVAKAAAAAVLAGAGAAVIASTAKRKPFTTLLSKSSNSAPRITTATVAPITSKLNKKAVAAAGIASVAGVSAIAANRIQKSRSLTKIQPSASIRPNGELVESLNNQRSTSSPNIQSSFRTSASQFSQEPDPWEGKVIDNKITTPQSSDITLFPKISLALPSSNQVIADPKTQIDDLGLTKTKDNEHISGVNESFFVQDKKGDTYLFKQSSNPYWTAAEITAARIGEDCNVPINKVELIKPETNTPLKSRSGKAATLHHLVPGTTLLEHQVNTGEEYQTQIHSTSDKSAVIKKGIVKHPDLAKIIALDLFTRNTDGHAGNIMIDAQANRMYSIDKGMSFRSFESGTEDLCKELVRYKDSEAVSKASPEEQDNLNIFLSTLKQLHERYPPQRLSKLYSNNCEASGVKNFDKEEENIEIQKTHKAIRKILQVYQML